MTDREQLRERLAKRYYRERWTDDAWEALLPARKAAYYEVVDVILAEIDKTHAIVERGAEVFLLYYDDYDSCSHSGIFASLEAAEEAECWSVGNDGWGGVDVQPIAFEPDTWDGKRKKPRKKCLKRLERRGSLEGGE